MMDIHTHTYTVLEPNWGLGISVRKEPKDAKDGLSGKTQVTDKTCT